MPPDAQRALDVLLQRIHEIDPLPIEYIRTELRPILIARATEPHTSDVTGVGKSMPTLENEPTGDDDKVEIEDNNSKGVNDDKEVEFEEYEAVSCNAKDNKRVSNEDSRDGKVSKGISKISDQGGNRNVNENIRVTSGSSENSNEMIICLDKDNNKKKDSVVVVYIMHKNQEGTSEHRTDTNIDSTSYVANIDNTKTVPDIPKSLSIVTKTVNVAKTGDKNAHTHKSISPKSCKISKNDTPKILNSITSKVVINNEPEKYISIGPALGDISARVTDRISEKRKREAENTKRAKVRRVEETVTGDDEMCLIEPSYDVVCVDSDESDSGQ